MKYRSIFAGAAFAVSLVLAGCGGASGDLASFKPPAGWRAVNIFGMSMYLAPDSAKTNGQMLMLMRVPNAKSNGDFSIATARFGKDATIQEKKTIDICGKQPAQYVAFTGNQQGHPDKVEMVVTRYGNTTYFAMYARPKTVPANVDAETAIKSLCLKT
ncbi:MAG TPA: hypothetical protein VIG51_02145 [Candidatus Baltobacteraceae bacterium]|jgi:hypothetical protein